jgi:multidrug resistance protein
MTIEHTAVNEKEVLESTESAASTDAESPIADRKRKHSHSSEEYDSDSTDSAEDDRISIRVVDEDANGLQAIRSKGGNTLTRHATGVSTRTGISVATTTDPNFEIDFEDDDLSDPHNWAFWYRCLIIFMISYSTLTVVMYSTSYTSAIPGIMSTFGIDSKTIPVLGITTYMIGLALGSVVLAPLSEMYGRRPIYLIAMAMFCLLTIPCALAPNLEAILITRFFGAIAGSALISNSPGTVNDIVTEEYRALAFSLWSIGPMNGPVVGPLVGGFVFQYLGWRWACFPAIALI